MSEPKLSSEWSEQLSLDIQQCITRDGEEDPPGSIADILERSRKATARECARLELDPLKLPEDLDAAHIYKVAWADFQQAIAREHGLEE